LVYPVAIALVILNNLPKKWSSKTMFRVVLLVTVLFSLPSSLAPIGVHKPQELLNNLPMGSSNLFWIFPAQVSCFVVQLVKAIKTKYWLKRDSPKLKMRYGSSKIN